MEILTGGSDFLQKSPFSPGCAFAILRDPTCWLPLRVFRMLASLAPPVGT
jgi:hypothetical protein